MAEFILELYSEEIPAGMQARAADNLARLVTALLAKADLHPTQSKTYVAPQRLALLLDGLDTEIPARSIEKKGPRVTAPAKTIEGFLKAQGLTDTKQLQIKQHPKGDFYLSVQHTPARATKEFLTAELPQLISTFVWPKSMRWGAGRLRWVRPLRSILCLFDGQPVPFAMDELASELIAGDVTYGHRFLAPAPIKIKRNKDYLPALEKAKVLADPQARMERIQTQAQKLAKAKGLELMANEKLLAEIIGLIEWPVCLMGEIDKNFLTLPPEVLTAVMHTHQKYLTLKEPKSDKLAPYFIIIANMETKDKGTTIIAGNERVLRARLADAAFFWTQDKKTILRDRLPHLENIIFHAQLGTVADKAERLQKLAPQIASHCQIAEQARKQGRESTAPHEISKMIADTGVAGLCKADLVTSMVVEFPSLQGIMGGYYAAHDGLGEAVAAAIRDHYKPLGPNDKIPATPASCIIALTDKIDTLAGFWSIGEKPTGSKDPYALRRAALGIIRILLETKTHLPLCDAFALAFDLYDDNDKLDKQLIIDLRDFVIERLAIYLHDKGIRADITQAVCELAVPSSAHGAHGAGKKPLNLADDIVEIDKKARQLNQFLTTEDGDNLLTAFQRAAGICAGPHKLAAPLSPALFAEADERALYEAIEKITPYKQLGDVEYGAFLKTLADLRKPIDNFFDKILVDHEDEKIKNNRYRLLNDFLNIMLSAANFYLIEKRK